MATVALPRTESKAPRFNIILALLTVYIIWGSTYLALHIAVRDLPPFLMTGFRFFTAGAIMFVYLRSTGAPNPTRLEWRNAFLIGTLLMGCGTGGVAFAEQWVASSVAAIAVATVPLWAAIFATFWGTRSTRGEWIGIGLGFTGIIILNLGGDVWVNTTGAIILLISPICWAFGSVWSRRLALPAGMMSSAAEMIGGGTTLMLFGLLQGENIQGTPSTDSVLAVLYLIFFGSILAFSAYVFLLKEVQPVVATSYAYVNPVIAVFLGWLINSEKLNIQTLIGAAIILTAVIVINTQRATQKPVVIAKEQNQHDG